MRHKVRMVNPLEETPLERVQRAVWGMMYAGDAGIASKSPVGLAGMMGVIVVVCQDFGLAVSENKTDRRHVPVVSSTQLPETAPHTHQGGRSTVRADDLTRLPW